MVLMITYGFPRQFEPRPKEQIMPIDIYILDTLHNNKK